MSSGEQFKYVSCYAHKGYFKSFKGVLFQRGCDSAFGSKNDNDTSSSKQNTVQPIALHKYALKLKYNVKIYGKNLNYS